MAGKNFKVELEGFNVLQRNLLDLTNALTGSSLDEAVEEAATVHQELQVELAPRDRGGLKASIERQRHKSSRRSSEWDSGPSRKGFWGLFQELGTIYHPAQPFMRPAFDAGKDTAERAFRSKLLAGIRRFLIRG